MRQTKTAAAMGALILLAACGGITGPKEVPSAREFIRVCVAPPDSFWTTIRGDSALFFYERCF
jgi:hypothetical protein